MPADPSIVDAAARAAEALAEFGRKVAAMPAAPATDDLAAELRRLADASARRWAEVRDELGSLRAAVERLAERQGLVDPVAEINRQARAEMASAQAAAPRAPRVRKQRANASALTPERKKKLIELWALPSAEMPGGAIRVHLNKMPGREVDRNAVFRWAHALNLPYRRKRAGDDAGEARRASASHAQPAEDASAGVVPIEVTSPVSEPIAGSAGDAPIAEDHIAHARNMVVAPEAVALQVAAAPPEPVGADDPDPRLISAAPPPPVVVPAHAGQQPQRPAPTAPALPRAARDLAPPPPTRADLYQIRAWAAPRCIRVEGPRDVAAVNAKRASLGLSAFELIDLRGEVVR